LVVEDGMVDVCNFDPGYEIDLVVTTSLRTMTAIWMGLTTVKDEASAGTLDVEGDRKIAEPMQEWLGLSIFAKVPRRVQ
jgi:hypothetical protein